MPVSRVAQSVQPLAKGSTVRDRIPVGGEIFRTYPNRPWGLPSLLYNGYRFFTGGKERPGRVADPSLPSSAVVMKGQSYTSTPPMAIRPVQSLSACTKKHFTLPLQICQVTKAHVAVFAVLFNLVKTLPVKVFSPYSSKYYFIQKFVVVTQVLCIYVIRLRNVKSTVLFTKGISADRIFFHLNRKYYLLRIIKALNINKIQQDATACRYLFTAKSLYMFRVSIAPIIRST